MVEVVQMGFSVGTVAIVAFVVVLLFGASKIPELMRSLGAGLGQFKRGLKDGEVDRGNADDVR